MSEPSEAARKRLFKLTHESCDWVATPDECSPRNAACGPCMLVDKIQAALDAAAAEVRAERQPCIVDGCADDARRAYAVCYNHRQRLAEPVEDVRLAKAYKAGQERMRERAKCRVPRLIWQAEVESLEPEPWGERSHLVAERSIEAAKREARRARAEEQAMKLQASVLCECVLCKTRREIKAGEVEPWQVCQKCYGPMVAVSAKVRKS